MQELSANEVEQVGGAYMVYSAGMFFVGLGAAIVGGALVVAGLGTPISIGGAALAAEGAAAMGVGLVGG